jgi:hypothetical protein
MANNPKGVRMPPNSFEGGADGASASANMGSSVIQAIEMILWGGLSMMGHDSDG